jgi:outer membrane translocation and assembly module TamA
MEGVKMNLFKIAQCTALSALLWASQRPIETKSQKPADETESSPPVLRLETEIPSPDTILETIDLEADVGLDGLNLEHLTRTLKQRHWDNDDWVEELQQRVVRAWQTLGYYKAEADVSGRRIRKSPQERVYAAKVKVHAGRLFRLGEIQIVHAKQFTSDDLRSLFRLEAGDIFNVQKVQAGLEGLRQAYESRGFIKVTSVPESTIDEAHDRISLTVDVDEGPQFHISEIKVLGLDSTLVERLLHDAGLKPGDVYSNLLVEGFFAKNSKALPPGANAEDQTRRKIDEQMRTISLIFDFSDCNPRCD